MLARLALRAPIAASKRAVRFNSSSSSRASSIIEMAAQAERPCTSDTHGEIRESLLTHDTAATEVAVPVMWAVCGALTFAAWNRMDARSAGDNVEKLLIV
jgi:hypothetical protein